MPARTLLPHLLFALLLAGFAACSKHESAVQSGLKGQILHWGNLGEPTDLDPHITASQQDFNIVMNLFEGLTTYDPRDLPDTRTSDTRGRADTAPDARASGPGSGGPEPSLRLGKNP